jgi:hypothetical protein
VAGLGRFNFWSLVVGRLRFFLDIRLLFAYTFSHLNAFATSTYAAEKNSVCSWFSYDVLLIHNFFHVTITPALLKIFLQRIKKALGNYRLQSRA